MSNYGTSDRSHYFLGSHAIYNNSTSYSASSPSPTAADADNGWGMSWFDIAVIYFCA